MFADMNAWDRQRRDYKQLKSYYYHLSSDGWKDGLLFHTKEHYAFGMTLIGLLTVMFGIVIFEFTLMPNHIHILMKGNGEQCVKAFDYFRRKLSALLVHDGYPPLPEDYRFKLTPIDTEEQMRVNILYVARNPYEKGLAVPGGYPWGTAYLHYSILTSFLHGKEAGQMTHRERYERTRTRTPIPPSWEWHPKLGLLPLSFIDHELFFRLFPTPKHYETRLVKDYEAFVKLGKSLDETVFFSENEMIEIVQASVRDLYPGKRKEALSPEEKGRLCVELSKTYQLSSGQMAEALNMSEYLVKQFLYAKDFGKQRL